MIVLFEQVVSGFNLDTDVPVVKRSAATARYDTYFGFSVSAHHMQHLNVTV